MYTPWQQTKQITVPGSGTATFSLARGTVLDRLTIWAVSNKRVITNLSFQPQVNGNNFGSAVAVTGTAAFHVVYASGGTNNDRQIPFKPPALGVGELDPFDFTVLITNADASPAIITIYAAAFSGG